MTKSEIKDRFIVYRSRSVISLLCYIIIALLVVVAGETFYIFSFTKDNEISSKIHEITEETHRKQLEIIKESHQKEMALREERIVSYLEAYEELEERYQEDKKELTKLKKERTKKKLEEYNKNKQAFAHSLELEYGFKYVE